MTNEGTDSRIERLRETLATIERMLDEQRRDDYFEALRQKRANGGSGSVTASFFGSSF